MTHDRQTSRPGLVARVARELRRPASAIATLVRMGRGQSDVEHWADADNLRPDWDARTAHLATFVPPDTAVLEFGAARLVLRDMLPSGCRYVPSDLVDRGPGTFVCDLNADTLPAPPAHDVAVFSGVLEYVHDLPRLVGWLRDHSACVVTSYAVTDVPRPQSRFKRLKHGWVNALDRAGFEALFTDAGYARDAFATRGRQHLYRFQRHDSGKN